MKPINPTYTTREYNDEGVCIRCTTHHFSFYDHGYRIEYALTANDRLFMTIIPDHGRPYVREAEAHDVKRWKLTQRNPLMESKPAKDHTLKYVNQIVGNLISKPIYT